jgi:hypothetical protein
MILLIITHFSFCSKHPEKQEAEGRRQEAEGKDFSLSPHTLNPIPHALHPTPHTLLKPLPNTKIDAAITIIT